ncbi:conserved Plasmodium protein, unknown function [Plasmodium knowlesi strain H]|uniref:Uncharacterized protein n=3 Tax=Plasmodium knowlesi TaxID=5850 RepID=A0A5K1U9H7_PLAKH|nr:conserved Plasmodium protein, unknown function [Plasmodium knowlesi strain H]OTN66648.1 Uncharacterized protein PKNOH_S08498700 [Plasmodium knowlesi]CAA9986744.1 conserved Plasmodium protein, unknown function [Plasmodium knowlesi strain H]SBO23568.1 conserved Plasmodium protein, unknown function [Plasmodium knowlesi strain H]SBO25104.1 conserved Plasmodium protein, unknown function [Plasmodium knowlesi strain H]VVS76218.1 conserved Plasmodium protein, unknown function [Plasmodium knowlesi s|eukprot:XP_002257928.1 hypothetical protein, conserved in Plasmodium species [Plasmodium knowlesi strain H]
MNAKLTTILLLLSILHHQLWEVTCVKNVNVPKVQIPTNGGWKRPFAAHQEKRANKRYLICSGPIFKKTNKLRKKYSFHDLIYSNRRKKITNLIYIDVMNKDKKKLAEALDKIVQKQESLSFPLVFKEIVNNFHTHFFYYFVLVSILDSNPWMLCLLKKVNKLFRNKFRANLFGKITSDISTFERKYIWNGVLIDRYFKRLLKKHYRKLRVLVDACLKKDEYFCHSVKQSRCTYNHEDNNYDDDKFHGALRNIHAIHFYNIFEEHFFKKTINTIMKMINTNVHFSLLKNFISDRYTAQQIMYTHKTFFALTLQKNTTPLFSSFVEMEKLNTKMCYLLDETVKKQLDVAIPNLRIMNFLNLSLIVTKLMLNKLLQVVFYFVMLYIKKKAHERGGPLMRVLSAITFG